MVFACNPEPWGPLQNTTVKVDESRGVIKSRILKISSSCQLTVASNLHSFLLTNSKGFKSISPRGFFDNITTTTTMKPPRMGVGSLAYQKQRPQQQNPFFRNAKGNPCASERLTYYPNNLSTGSLSLNESKTSYDGVMDRTTSDKSDHNISKASATTDDSQQGLETEPEWFSFPASRHDVIDLHGFEDEIKTDKSALTDDSHRPSIAHSPNKLAHESYDDFVRNRIVRDDFIRQDKKPASPQFHRRQHYNPQSRFEMNNIQKNNDFYNQYRNNFDQSRTNCKYKQCGKSNRSNFSCTQRHTTLLEVTILNFSAPPHTIKTILMQAKTR